MLIANLTTTSHTARSSKTVLLFSSLLGVTSQFIPLSSDVAENYVPSTKKKQSLKVLIHILYMIGPSIVRASKGRFDAFMGWQFCRYCFTMLPPNNSDCIGLHDAISSTGSKFNQSGIRWDVTSAWLFPIGRWWHSSFARRHISV